MESNCKDGFMGHKTFRQLWIAGVDSICTSNIHYHNHSDQHGSAYTCNDFTTKGTRETLMTYIILYM